METVKLNSHNVDVLFLQSLLGLPLTGLFDANTDKKVKEYQASKKLLVDGVVGDKTWSTFPISKLTENDYLEAAKILNCDVASVKAIKEVESGSNGFVDMVRPTILFEGHLFYKYVKEPSKVASTHPNICYPNWDRSKYKGGNSEYNRLNEAFLVDKTAALKSASMGLFQILGKHYDLCGCKSVEEMWGRACKSEKEQLVMFCTFLKNSGIDTYVRAKNWAEVAKRYNGPAYAKNKYDIRLKTAYEKYKK